MPVKETELKTFTGWEYMLIDLANQFGHDKMVFEDRLKWANEHLHELENFSDEAETPPLYHKAVKAIRKAQQGEAIGHLVGFDACCSGVQIMSALTGCVAGATATGMVNPNVRADAYSSVTDAMNAVLHTQGLSVDIPRKDAKRATMTSFYGSKNVPVEIFGEETPELNAFYQAAVTVAPGAWELLQDLVASWQPWALSHGWKLPDGYDARVKVMKKIKARVEVDELDHTSFTYEFYENQGMKRDVSNAANVVHSIDAYVLRCIHRRCNYNAVDITTAYVALLNEQELRLQGYTQQVLDNVGEVGYYRQQYERSGIADVVILPYLKDGHQTQYLSDTHLEQLVSLVQGMLAYEPFEVITIHDEFKCHPNNMNHLRQQYINVLAELAESELLADILNQIHGKQGSYPKLSNNLGDLIRKSNYALS